MPIYKIIASQIGDDAGPFTIKNNLGQVIATGITREQLLNGYSFNVALGITSITLESTGNCTNSTNFTIPNEGFWEMEKNNVEEVSDHYGAIQTAYTAPVETFVAKDIIGVYTGVVSGSGIWLIKGTAEAIAGTTYNPNGLLIVTNANTNTATTVEGGAIVQLGYDLNTTKGSFGGTTTVNAGGIVNVIGADETARVAIGSFVNNGSLNFTGKDSCGEGYFRNNGVFTNTGLITIDKAKFQLVNSTTFGVGNGNILVKNGSTFKQNGVNLPASQTFQLNGCGKCNASGIEEGALLYGGSTTIASPIFLQSDVCIKAVNAGVTTFSGKLTGSSKLTIGNSIDTLTAKYGTISFTNNANAFTGALDLVSTSMSDSHPLAFQYSDVRMFGLAYISSTQSMTFKSLGSESTSTEIVTWANPIVLTDNGITTFAGLIKTSSAGFSTVTIDGVGNQISFTNTGNHSAGFRVLDGAKMEFLGGGGIGQLSVENGSKFTFGKTTTGFINTGTLTMTGNSILEVQAVSPTSAGTFISYGAFNVTGGFKVDLPEALNAGTYNILRAAGGGTGAGIIPTLGVNNTGKTATFSWSGQYLRVTLV